MTHGSTSYIKVTVLADLNVKEIYIDPNHIDAFVPLVGCYDLFVGTRVFQVTEAEFRKLGLKKDGE